MFAPRASDCKDLTTEDNHTPIVEGMRLYNYYDGEWGVVEFNSHTEEDGWFYLRQDDGSKALLNGVRVSTKEI